MTFGINYNGGYEVCVTKVDDDGSVRTHALRNFGERQGDAKIFKDEDCPKLSIPQLQALIKRFDRGVKYQRVSNKKFIKQ